MFSGNPLLSYVCVCDVFAIKYSSFIWKENWFERKIRGKLLERTRFLMIFMVKWAHGDVATTNNILRRYFGECVNNAIK